MENESKNFSNDDLISILKDEPVFDKILEEWTCPEDYHYLFCPSCKYDFRNLKPIKKHISNQWVYCKWCDEELSNNAFGKYDY